MTDVPRLISLLTCTRNPDPLLFDRLVAGVEALEVPAGWEREWVIVDHRSTSALADRPAVAAALARSPWIRVVTESEAPRVAGARARSIDEAGGEAVVLLDDDCVPAPDYLQAAVRLLDAHPEVHCWGPGRVTLDLMGQSAPDWFDAHWRTTFFQERSATDTAWSRVRGWAPSYASGVGMVMRTAPAREYAARVRDGRYVATTRSTASVVCGEDAQMLWTAILLGGAAGSSPTLALRHAVREGRLDLAYARRLTFGLRESVLPCQTEVFGTSAGLPGRLRAVREQAGPVFRALLKLPGEQHAHGVLELAGSLGALTSVWRVHERPEPWWLRAFIERLRTR